MPNNEKKIKFKDTNLQLYSMIKKYAPEAADALLEESEATGRSIEEIIASAIQFRHLAIQAMRAGLSLDQLLVAFEFWDTIYRRALQSAFVSTGLWKAFMEVFLGFLEAYSSIYSTAEKAKREDAYTKLVSKFTKLIDEAMKNMKNINNSLIRTSMPMFTPYDITKPTIIAEKAKKGEKK